MRPRQAVATLVLCSLLAAPVLASENRSEPLRWTVVPRPGPSVVRQPEQAVPGPRRVPADDRVPSMQPPSPVDVGTEPPVRRPVVAIPNPPLIVVNRSPTPSGGLERSGNATSRRTGVASYYDDGPGLYAAVHSYRWGQPRYNVRVCRRDDRSRCVTVTVRDHCACFYGTSDERLIDLSPKAMFALGGTGLLWVAVEGLR